jgi:hypothetical protein
MITAGVSAAVVGLLGLFGITPTAAQIAGIVVVTKGVVVATGTLVTLRVTRRKRRAARLLAGTRAATEPSSNDTAPTTAPR